MYPALSRRERQIMEAIYRRGSATVSEVRGDLPDPPSYSAVRATLRILEEKGLVRHRQDGPRYVFRPTMPRGKASQRALSQLVKTFFGGSPEQAVAALLDLSKGDLSKEDLDRIARLIEDARRKGR
jgi:predicted transcriptional regulator